MQDYKGYKYWLVETIASGIKRWRIERPDGTRTASLDRAKESDIQSHIDMLIEEGALKVVS